jgi:hypothetical protein
MISLDLKCCLVCDFNAFALLKSPKLTKKPQNTKTQPKRAKNKGVFLEEIDRDSG